MFNKEELKAFKNDLNQLGITEEKEKKDVIEFFYKLGKIIYDFKIYSYGEEN